MPRFLFESEYKQITSCIPQSFFKFGFRFNFETSNPSHKTIYLVTRLEANLEAWTIIGISLLLS